MTGFYKCNTFLQLQPIKKVLGQGRTMFKEEIKGYWNPQKKWGSHAFFEIISLESAFCEKQGEDFLTDFHRIHL